MKKGFLIILFATIMFIISGCNSIETDNYIRISGIIDACKANPELRQQYLQQKVQKKEISKIVSFTIQECLK